ncbi:hypothetical protein MPTK1_5g05430 [Marchantia polymorpha subsp. ruderalis]|nr:hypothetical protein MARPO_0027s0081 [Marchantia polymorpha]PTQ42969.1 hypothetical protein MARPO_0027s0084 [Marchantia polymorpha]BBN10666.1 hypothetical protein Mp_5g05430 [Marchantia polymorpha subsp. ruderalis]BBN10667.1 hypothetical protein Mp_5g05440 [Marchantia polymorpha subsp. ruderalis]|eukprot:PTQ42966.1 hypothetical protein MARPO_0027s0081 [Marchantia polymorpha]
MASGRTALVASVLLSCIIVSSAFNVTTMLDKFPSFSEMNKLLSSSGVAEEINSRKSLTLLALSNDVLTAFTASNPNVDAVKLADLLRYHVLLQFLGMDDLKALPTDNYTAVTTLYQTTGRANDNDGFVNIYNLPSGILVGPSVAGSSSNATVATNITNEAFDISIIQINSILTPVGFNTATGDLIKVLETFKDYTMFISLLKDSGVDSIFAGRQTGGGITVFAPTDSAFNGLTSASLQALSVTDLKLLMQYHALTSYQPLDILQNMVDSPVSTIASTIASGYLLNVSSAVMTVTLHTGVNDAKIIETLYDARPVTMFGIDAVLLPAELFSKDALVPTPAEAPVPEASAPDAAPEAAPGPEKPAGSPASVVKMSVALSAVAMIASSLVAAL